MSSTTSVIGSKARYLLRHPLHLFVMLLTKPFRYFDFLYKTTDYQCYVPFGFWFKQKVLNIGGNKKAYWPVHPTSKVFDAEKIEVGVDAYPGIMGGCYITGRGGLTIGDFTQIAPNVVIVTSNHDVYDNRQHIEAPIKIGRYCWIGAGATILPGVTLGDNTVVAAGAVVTKSFSEGMCIVGGVPARKIKELDPDLCVRYSVGNRFRGYLSEDAFLKRRAVKAYPGDNSRHNA